MLGEEEGGRSLQNAFPHELASATSNALSNPKPPYASHSQWSVSDSHHVQSENPIGYAHPDNPSQASFSRQIDSVLQNLEKYQTQLQEYAAKRLPGSSDLRATQGYLESEKREDDGYPDNPTAQQLPEQSLRIHNSDPEHPAPLESLIRGMLQWPLIAQAVLSQMPRRLADSGPVLVDLTNEETSDSDDNQQDNLEHRPGNFNVVQVQRYAGHSLTEVSFPDFMLVMVFAVIAENLVIPGK
ncbi:unnamed protein product [Gongylonema pulchrum]|uniref:Uncharacterized protein n=1 Tax=Gongylonema pulchrum TaxID=637853 RepID=A0A183DQ77_9BILA|nr:unnamed protein product [Gongylonema pulchrum]